MGGVGDRKEERNDTNMVLRGNLKKEKKMKEREIQID